MRLQILSTEHWSLLASRGLAWNESFTRAGMFLSTLSFAVVALALVGQASGFDEGFRLFALVVLPVVLFLGIATALRLDSANYHDALCVIGMNRIRAEYLKLAPDLEHVFVMGTTDDLEGIGLTMATTPGRGMRVAIMVATPTLLTVLNGVLVGAIVSVALVQLGAEQMTSLGVGAVAFVLAVAVQVWFASRSVGRLMSGNAPMYPAPAAPLAGGTPPEPPV
jgi:hypothetical protein